MPEDTDDDFSDGPGGAAVLPCGAGGGKRKKRKKLKKKPKKKNKKKIKDKKKKNKEKKKNKKKKAKPLPPNDTKDCRGQPYRSQPPGSMTCAQYSTSMVIESMSKPKQRISADTLAKKSAKRAKYDEDGQWIGPGYDPVGGTIASDIPTMLDNEGVKGAEMKTGATTKDVDDALATGNPIIMRIEVPYPDNPSKTYGHFIVVDKVVIDKKTGAKHYEVRNPEAHDPNTGGCGKMSAAVFEQQFTNAKYNTIITIPTQPYTPSPTGKTAK